MAGRAVRLESRTLTESTLELPGWLYGGADLEITYEADE